MIVAIAKDGDFVSGHFGHCKEYALYTIEDSQITGLKILANPGHEPGKLPIFLADNNVTHVIAGGIGQRASDLLTVRNIHVYPGISGIVKNVIQDFIDGKITKVESFCSHDSYHHECHYNSPDSPIIVKEQ